MSQHRSCVDGLIKNFIEDNSGRKFVIASHLDADGITSASIAYSMLKRCGVDCETLFTRQVDEQFVNSLASVVTDDDVLMFTDLGSGVVPLVQGMNVDTVILDHHVPVVREMMVQSDDGRHIIHQFNPHLIGHDGAIHLSGSGTAYLIASHLDSENVSLSPLAVVGAVGDMQDSYASKLIGLNRDIAQDGVDHGLLSVDIDIRFFGRQTRTVAKMLEYATDPFLPGLSGREEACVDFVRQALSTRLIEYRWIELSDVDRAQMLMHLMQYCQDRGISTTRLIGEVYTLLRESEGTELRDAKEFATLLNATARYNCPDVGMGVCLGDRGSTFDRARELLAQHRQNLAKGVEYVKDIGLKQMSHVQYFDAEDNIFDSIVGIVAGMVFSVADRSKPILAFARSENGIKVSARGTYDQVDAGLNLAAVMNRAAVQVGGIGGGHSIAAGATIPDGTMEKFLEIANEMVKDMIENSRAQTPAFRPE